MGWREGRVNCDTYPILMIIKVTYFPWPFDDWVEAVTFWPFIFMIDPDNEKLLRHEKVHLKQQARGLLIFFYIRYFYFNWKYGYRNNPYEIEARNYE